MSKVISGTLRITLEDLTYEEIEDKNCRLKVVQKTQRF